MRICIIPATGRCDRLPMKNILPINGRPILAYSVETALESGLFEKVIVSTEHPQITEVAMGLGCEIYPHPPRLNVPHTTVVDVCLMVLREFHLRTETVPEHFCCLYATAPAVTVRNLRESMEMLERTDFVMGVEQQETHPAHLLEQDGDILRPVNIKLLKRKGFSIGEDKFFHSNGTLYWARTIPFKALKTFYGPRLMGYGFPKYEHIDIDYLGDYVLAKILYESRFPANPS